MSKKAYICCCGQYGRAVIFGYSDRDPVVGEAIELADAKMVIYWSAKCGGLLGLAARGPQEGTRITEAVSRTSATVSEWIEVSSEVAEKVSSWPAC